MTYISSSELPVYEIINPAGRAPCVLTCEHAGIAVPDSMNLLGLSPEDYTRHYAYDIGAAAVTRALAARLDAPAILANYSRLIVDLNRSENHPTTFPVHGEGKPIPANLDMSVMEREERLDVFYRPYHKALSELIERKRQSCTTPALLSVHSFTRTFFKFVRPWHIGFLWAQDSRIACSGIEYFSRKGYMTGDNHPYDARICGECTAYTHGDMHKLPNVIIEYRNDLIDTAEKIGPWIDMSVEWLSSLLDDPAIISPYDGPKVVFDPEEEKNYFAKVVEAAKQGEQYERVE